MNDSGPEVATSSTADDADTDAGPDDGQGAVNDIADNRLLAESAPLGAELPRDLQVPLGRVLNEGPVETLGEWIAEIRRVTGGGPVGIDGLCRSEEETAHWGRTGGETYYFLCFYDAVVLSALARQPVDIRTESPDGTVIEARAAGTGELTVVPDGAVFSFGIDETVESPSDGTPSPSDVYAAVCPYVRAFPNLDVYDRWTTEVSAATVAMPLAGATDIAAALVE